MRRALLLLVVSLFASTSAAALTNDEKADIRKVENAITAAEEGMLYWGYTAQYIDESNRQTLSNLWRLMVRGNQRAGLWTAYVRHVNPFDGDAAASLNTQPVSYWVAQAWQHLDGMINNYLAAQQIATSAQQITGKPAAYYDNLRRIRDIHLAGAIALAKQVNRGRTYATWCESPITITTTNPDGTTAQQTLCTVVGPHGSFAESAGAGYFALNRYNQMQERVSDMLSANDPITKPDGTVDKNLLPNYNDFSRMPLRTVNVVRHFRAGYYAGLMVPISDAMCKANPFHLVAEGMLGTLNHTSESGHEVAFGQFVAGMPYHIDQYMGDVFDNMQTYTLTRPNLRAHWNLTLKDLSTAWRFANGWAERVFKFPSPQILDAIRNQGAVPPTAEPFAPPLCG